MSTMRRTLVLAACAALLLAALPAQASPLQPPRDQWYAENDTGHWGDGTRTPVDEGCGDAACSAAAFASTPFTVIGFVDSGINPYHTDFRAPEAVHHPSTYLEGFPADAQVIELSFDIADTQGYAAARAADDARWQQLQPNRLYWFKGTRIIGGYSTRAGGTSSTFPERRILDDQGHGTGVASTAAGQRYGSNPEALIVMVEGLGAASLDWLAAQSWVDVNSNSWGNIGNLPLGSQASTRAATRRGQTVAFAAGNGAGNQNSHQVFPVGPVADPCECKFPDSNPSFTSPYGGPSWILTVGAISPINGQAHWWHSIPVDVSSFGSKWRVASPFTVDDSRDFGGTSNATPVTAGVLSSYLLEARRVLGDTTGGQRPDQVIAAAPAGASPDLPASGPLADGVLTRAEVEELVQKTAFPVEANPEQLTWDYAVRPTTSAYYVYQGYGVVDRDAKARGMAILAGEAELTDRTEVDEWIARVDVLRETVWGRP
jgi:hypothetical protein